MDAIAERLQLTTDEISDLEYVYSVSSNHLNRSLHLADQCH